MKNLNILPPPGSHIVIKVDVEGSECRALAGASEYLHTVNIDYVALEMAPDRSSGVWDNVYNCSLLIVWTTSLMKRQKAGLKLIIGKI